MTWSYRMYINIGLRGISKLACLTSRALWCASPIRTRLWAAGGCPARSGDRGDGALPGDTASRQGSFRRRCSRAGIPPFVSCQSQLWQTVRRRQPARRSAHAAAMRVPVRCIPHSVLTRSISLLQDKTDATKRFVIKQARTRLCYCAHCDKIAAVAIAAVAISAVAISAVAIPAVTIPAVAIAAVALASHTLTRSPRA